MEPTAQGSYDAWIGYNVYDMTGEKIGSIEQIYYDDVTARPEWVAIKTGWFGTSLTFAPIVGSTRHEDGLMVAYTKDVVKDAPHIDAEGAHLEPAEEELLYKHYGLAWEGTETFNVENRADYGYQFAPPAATEVTTAPVSRELVSEEALGTESEVAVHAEIPKMGKETVETGRVRLRRYLITEQVTMPVTREEVRVERDVDMEVEGDVVIEGDVTTNTTTNVPRNA